MVLVAKNKRPPTGFGPRLKAIREGKGLSLSEVGRRAQIAYQTIAKYEREENEPTWVTVLALAAAMGVEPNDFLPNRGGD